MIMCFGNNIHRFTSLCGILVSPCERARARVLRQHACFAYTKVIYYNNHFEPAARLFYMCMSDYSGDHLFELSSMNCLVFLSVCVLLNFRFIQFCVTQPIFVKKIDSEKLNDLFEPSRNSDLSEKSLKCCVLSTLFSGLFQFPHPCTCSFQNRSSLRKI